MAITIDDRLASLLERLRAAHAERARCWAARRAHCDAPLDAAVADAAMGHWEAQHQVLEQAVLVAECTLATLASMVVEAYDERRGVTPKGR